CSIRTIAKNAGVTTGNIYNYFQSKDEIFVEILRPTVFFIDSAISADSSFLMVEQQEEKTIEWYRDRMKMIVSFIDQNRDDLDLLLFKSKGSSLYAYKDLAVEKYTELITKHLKALQKGKPEVKVNITPYFWHSIAKYFMNVVNEVIGKKMSGAEFEKFSEEIIHLMYHGFESLYKSNVEKGK
ncbi:MAG: TetR/AcrR family transcriptional regulator, partial [Bacteroidota bacterium]